MVSCCISPAECLLAYSVDTLCNFKYDYKAVHDCHVAVDNESRELQEEWCQQRAWAAEGGERKLVYFMYFIKLCFNMKISFSDSFKLNSNSWPITAKQNAFRQRAVAEVTAAGCNWGSCFLRSYRPEQGRKVQRLALSPNSKEVLGFEPAGRLVPLYVDFAAYLCACAGFPRVLRFPLAVQRHAG